MQYFLNAAINATLLTLLVVFLAPLGHFLLYVIFGPRKAPVAAPVEVISPRSVPAVAAAIAKPVATLTIPVESVDYNQLNVPELRKRCTAAGIRWRNVRGTKHLSRAEMLAALKTCPA